MLVENKVLAEFAELIREKKTQPYSGELKTGVDLGTANIVIAVTDSENRPVAGASAPSHVVKDGIVVDFIGAIRTVKELKGNSFTIAGLKQLNNGDGLTFFNEKGELEGFRVNRVEANRIFTLDRDPSEDAFVPEFRSRV